MVFNNFLFETPSARVDGIAFINWSRKLSKKSKSVLSTFAYSNNCWIFWIGFPRYEVTVPTAPETEPVTVSPVSNLWLDDIKILPLLVSSTRTLAVALEIEPVIVSLLVNLPVVPAPFSKTILSPPSSKIYSKLSTSERNLSIDNVSFNSPYSKNW